MKMPSFSAEASAYRSTVHYHSGAALGEVSGSYTNPAQIMRLPALGTGGGGGCHPWYGDCVPDKSCSTGMSQRAMTANCQVIKDCTCSLGKGGGGGGTAACPQNAGEFGACCEGLFLACEPLARWAAGDGDSLFVTRRAQLLSENVWHVRSGLATRSDLAAGADPAVTKPTSCMRHPGLARRALERKSAESTPFVRADVTGEFPFLANAPEDPSLSGPENG